jgi:hypothetical protein
LTGEILEVGIEFVYTKCESIKQSVEPESSKEANLVKETALSGSSSRGISEIREIIKDRSLGERAEALR